jgi:predicted HTH domain antitoxin
MNLTIPDDILSKAGMTERDVRIEVACRLFDARKLGKSAASRLAGLSRIDFEEELIKRNLPILHLDEEYWRQEMESLKASEERERRKQ